MSDTKTREPSAFDRTFAALARLTTHQTLFGHSSAGDCAQDECAHGEALWKNFWTATTEKTAP